MLTLSASEREVIQADNAFGFKLFARLGAAEPGNLFVSPLSVSLALAMTTNGARGETETAMDATLGHGAMDRAAVNGLYGRLMPALLAADPHVTFEIANSIWSTPLMPPEPSFLEVNRATFNAETRTLDFASAQAGDVINGWVSDKTHGKIPGIVPQGPLDPDLVMLLINALYFKGDWSTQFDEKKTYDGEFHLADGSLKTARMMYMDTSFRFFDDGAVRGLELPYGDSLFSMVLLQPADPEGLGSLLAGLSAETWRGYMGRLAVQSGPIHVPKFKIEWKKSLAEVLTQLGMGVAFSSEADFTGIHKSGLLFLTDVFHKTYINVDEKGTEAAAVTAVLVGVEAAPVDLVRFDRPFLFAIRERSTGAVLFLGRVMDPTL